MEAEVKTSIHFGKVFCVLTGLFLVFNISAKAQQFDSTEVFRAILSVDHFNDDLKQDTLIGASETSRRFVPRAIVWADDPTSGIPDSLKVDYTKIIYPTHWQNLRASYNLKDINNDNYLDMILFFWGKVGDEISGYEDTTRAVVLFGQRGLDTMNTIVLADIGSFQITPFVAMDMRFDHELKDPEIMDLSGITNYLINDISLSTTDTSCTPPPIATDINTINPELNVYPNPAVYYTNLQMNNLSSGLYTMQLIDLNGECRISNDINISSGKELIERLDLKDIPTGYYILQLTKGSKIIGRFQIIVVH